MPSREAVASFVAMVERNEFIEAILEYYAESASMQENLNPPRIGLDALLTSEREALKRFVPPVAAKCLRFAINEDNVVINWLFEYGRTDGRHVVLDEVAWQVWSGDKIIRERFYYDSARLR